jgi:hypothetical protein
MRLFTFKLLLVSVVAGALMLAGSAAVFADTGVQNPQYVVSVDLTPDGAKAGDPITVSGSVTNTTWRWQTTRICMAWRVGDREPERRCRLVDIAPKGTRSMSRTFAMANAQPGTTIDVRLSAANLNGNSYATDSLTLS